MALQESTAARTSVDALKPDPDYNCGCMDILNTAITSSKDGGAKVSFNADFARVNIIRADKSTVKIENFLKDVELKGYTVSHGFKNDKIIIHVGF